MNYYHMYARQIVKTFLSIPMNESVASIPWSTEMLPVAWNGFGDDSEKTILIYESEYTDENVNRVDSQQSFLTYGT